jgi:hypothetical protein
MDLLTIIMTTYPELTNDDFNVKGCIELRDDGDGISYIHKWEYNEPIPNGLTLGKPNA